MLVVIVVHVVAALGAPWLVRVLGRRAFFPLSLVPAASCAWVVTTPLHEVTVPWIPGIHLDITLLLDPLSRLMAGLVLGIGTLILLYCSTYFSSAEPRLGRFAALLVAFAGVMFGLVTADNVLLLFLFWELTSVLSFLLVGHYARRASARRAATQALLVTVAGGLALLVGLIVLATAVGSYRLSDILSAAPTGTLIDVAVACVLAGALSKSALAPAHFWLPGAMAAPTPVSAYLHSAAMVKAGVYLVARLAPTFGHAGVWQPLVLGLGLFTLALGGWRALREFDLKLILAYSTVSQLGLITLILGIGDEKSHSAGLALLMAHALFKSTLFMIVGIVDHATGTRDIRALSGLVRVAPATAVIAGLGAASMAAFPPFLGFLGKEEGLAAILESERLSGLPSGILVTGVSLGSVLTVAYSLRFLLGTFRTKHDAPSTAVTESHRVSWRFLFAPALTATAGLALGIVAPGELALWHGVTLPLVLSAGIMAAGTTLYVAQRTIDSLRFDQPPLGDADRIYNATLRTIDTVSLRVTAFVQRGSLPTTLGTILTVFILVPLGGLLLGERTPLRLYLWDSPVQAIIALPAIACALGVILAQRRLAMVLLVSVVGYACAALFAFTGAPDLALTQVLVETVTLVVFVLVLRRLPGTVPPVERFHRTRVFLALGTGITVMILGAYALNGRIRAAVGSTVPSLAYHEGHGANAVNVLLVDLRAWDTLGEISVIVAAATGVASLMFAASNSPTSPATPAPSPAETRAAGGRAQSLRSIVLDRSARTVFPLMLVLSAYFLFAGHNAPGGGFAAGLVGGLALTLRYLTGGGHDITRIIPVRAGVLLGFGLTTVVLTAIVPGLLGSAPLSSWYHPVELPILGSVSLLSPLVFDIGVYLIVVGLILDILRSLGAELDRIHSIEPVVTSKSLGGNRS